MSKLSLIENIELKVLAYEKCPSSYQLKNMNRAYNKARNSIKNSYKKPNKPIITDVIPNWIKGF